MGVGHYTEPDVYAAARVFTGWNLARPGAATDGSQHYEFVYNAGQHDTAAKTFSFPIYPNGSKTIPARSAADGMQDGLDLINALAGNPNTARYLATKLYRFFVSEVRRSGSGLRRPHRGRLSAEPLRHESGDARRADVAAVLEPAAYFARYAWPVEFVVRALKDIGWTGFSVNDALTPLSNMGQTLFEPPDVSGWDAGQTWFSTGAMLARMNFASTLAGESEVQPGEGGEAERAATPGRALVVFPQRARDGAVRRLGDRASSPAICARPAPGPGATRSFRPRRPGSFT